jgi:hypothetical protein
MSIFFNKEVLFVKFPIFLPIIYGLLLYSFPNFETQLIFLSILILAETHFGATWPFFLDKVNYSHIKEKKIELIFFPILLTFFCIGGFFYFKNLFLLIFFAANMYHVTRQSYGVMNLYTKEPLEKSHYSKIIYFYNFIFFIIAFFRFYMPIISNEDLLFLNFSIILSLIFVLFFEYKRFGFSENFLTLITGALIFYPVCFVSNPVHAIIMGVTMHYSQYLYLTSKVIKKRTLENNNTKRSSISRFWSIVIIYSIVMSVLSIFGKNDSEFLKTLIFIPITGQMLHFYLDSQIWKFSEKHNRDNILKYL